MGARTTRRAAAKLRGAPGLARRNTTGIPPGPLADAVREAVDRLQTDIDNLRALVTDLRLATLDDMGAEAAIRDLGERAGAGRITAERPTSSPE